MTLNLLGSIFRKVNNNLSCVIICRNIDEHFTAHETTLGKKTFIFPKKKFWLTAACLQVYQHFLAFERLVTYPYSVRELIRALNPHGQAEIAHNSCHLPLSLH